MSQTWNISWTFFGLLFQCVTQARNWRRTNLDQPFGRIRITKKNYGHIDEDYHTCLGPWFKWGFDGQERSEGGRGGGFQFRGHNLYHDYISINSDSNLDDKIFKNIFKEEIHLTLISTLTLLKILILVSDYFQINRYIPSINLYFVYKYKSNIW